MIGLSLACGTVAAAIATALLVAKLPPILMPPKAGARNTALARWATLLKGLSAPASENCADSSTWDIGAPVQPAEFTRQLGSLQGALARAQEPVVSAGEEEVALLKEKLAR